MENFWLKLEKVKTHNTLVRVQKEKSEYNIKLSKGLENLKHFVIEREKINKETLLEKENEIKELKKKIELLEIENNQN